MARDLSVELQPSSPRSQTTGTTGSGPSQAGYSTAVQLSDCGDAQQQNTKVPIRSLGQRPSDHMHYSMEEWSATAFRGTVAVLVAAAKAVLPPQPIPFDADFFTDLGGHSLLAARFVSVVREEPALAGITLQDMYRARSLRAIAALVDGRAARRPARAAEDLALHAAALSAPLPVRPRAGARAAVHPVPDDRAVARRLRQLHAADRQRGDLLRGGRLAGRRLHGDQHRHHRCSRSGPSG